MRAQRIVTMTVTVRPAHEKSLVFVSLVEILSKDSSDRQVPDLVERNFTAERPNPLWVADITYIPT